MIITHTEAQTSRFTFDSSPIPNHMMNSGSRARGGIGRNNSTMGSKIPRMIRESPMAKPTGIPMTVPMTIPFRTRLRLAEACSQAEVLR